MGKVFVIAVREYRAIVGTKAFLIAIIMMPILMGGGIAVQIFLHNRLGPTERKIMVLDSSGVMFDKLAQAAKKRDNEILDNGKQIGPRYVLTTSPALTVTEEMRYDLSEQVRKGLIDAFVEIPVDVDKLPSGNKQPQVKFYAENAVVSDELHWFQGKINDFVHASRLKEAKIDPDLVARATAWINVEPLGLVNRSKAGQFSKPRESKIEETIFLPFGMMMLMFMVVFLAAQPMLESVLEEKSQRIAEVLLGSANSFQLMIGKLIGGVGGSLTVVVAYAAGGCALAWYYDAFRLVPLRIVPWFIVFQILAVMLFGSIFMAVGAAVNQLKEAQSMLMPIWLLMMFPIFVWFQVVRDPMGSFATWISFVPPATSLMMVLRMGSTAAVPLWQPLVGIVVMLAATLVCIFAAARIFRIGILAQGKTPKMSELFRWAIRG
ncbi:MAG: ABC transporter permease [Thermoguttaceae bacterium]|jgi:ABC-2 type transport system permease protein